MGAARNVTLRFTGKRRQGAVFKSRISADGLLPLMKKKRIAIIGAGPIGLEAAVAALDLGYKINVYERGEVADAVRRWGHIRMFSPFGMNVSMRGIERLKRAGDPLPDADAILTGTEYAAHYLVPLAETLGDSVHTNVEVAAIGRCDMLKCELMGSQERLDTPFRLLLRRGAREWNEEAELIFDCSGTFSTPNPIGDGGMPAVGETACKALISYGVPDIPGRQRWLFENRRVLVVGSGHSAAGAVRDLASLQDSAPETEVIWVMRRGHIPPYERIESDPLPERDDLLARANALVESGEIDFRAESTVLSLEQVQDGLKVTLADGAAGRETVVVDRVIASVGFRPDLELTRELQTRTCYATEGAYNLAAALLGEAAGGDCLSIPAFGAEALLHPEPGYFTLGMKSYGRTPNFLIRTGRDQIDSVLRWLAKDRQE